MEVKVYKQGIELEMFVMQQGEIDIDYDELVDSVATERDTINW